MPMNTSSIEHNLSTNNHAIASMYQQDDAIISFDSPYSLKDLGLGESNSDVGPEQFIDQQIFNIRLVNSEKKREKASLLVNKKYSWRGYSVDERVKTDPNRITLIAETEGNVVGTLTLCLDDKDTKLPADENFGDKLENLRLQRRRISEPSRLAIDDNAPKRVLAALLHIAYIYAHNIHGCTSWVAEVNPRHSRFYKRMLGFQEVEKERTCTRVCAPAVLLTLDLAYMAEQIKKLGGLMEKHGEERSYYPYFFSSDDELGITDRLKAGES